jgi:hypothetical protein
MALVGVVLVIIILLIVALVGGGSSKNPNGHGSSSAAATHKRAQAHRGAGSAGAPAAPVPVTLSLRPLGTVYVCLIGDGGRKLIPGVELQPGAATATYHARRFLITLGNSSVTMVVDGTPRSVPASNQAIGYSITKATGRRPLRAGQLPTCM